MRSPVDLTLAIAESLQRALAQISGEVESLPEPVHLRRAREAVESRFGSGVSALATVDRLDRIIDKMRTERRSDLKRGDRYILAHTIAQPSKRLGGKSVLATVELWKEPLSYWERETGLRRFRAAHWRGLFHSFLQAEPGPGTDRLREGLKAAWPDVVRQVRFEAPWIVGVKRHAGLLGKRPCEPYVEELLRGDQKLLSDLRATVSVPAASWFWGELTDSLVSSLGAATDQAFKSRVSLLLRLATEIPRARDSLLAATLDRYASCNAREPDPGLLAFALDAWNSPQLARNALWSQVEAGTKKMVSGWLALEDLEDFYQLCQGAGQVDEQRLRYWLRFKEQITFTQIVLGPELLGSRRPDVREFRERKKGRYATLTASTGRNNAIIMQIGKWVFVEFSEAGNACYPYREDELPFRIGESRYSLNDELKSVAATEASGAGRLIHRGNWEGDDFDPFLRRRGIHPGPEGVAPARTRTVERSMPRPPTAKRNAAAQAVDRSPPDPLTQRLVMSVQRQGGRIVDHRHAGGALWVLGEGLDKETYRALKALGFKVKLGKGLYL